VVYISIEGRGSNRYPFTYRDWYIVSGRVIGLGLDLGGISITVGSRVTQTKADGSFEAHGLTTGTHAVTLRKEGLGFSPPAVYISIVDRDIEGLLFSAAPQSLFLPVLSTSSITQITATTARSGGNVYSDGGYPVTARGVCWSTAPDPTTSDSRTNDGTGNGVFTSSITGLKPNTTYYARAYAVNSMGTKYGNEISFVTQQGYEYIGIGGLKWMLKNLDVDRYSNGDPIPQVTDMAQWAGLTTGAWCYYDNDPATGAIYGKLYNWYAVNDPRGLAPSGWRIPTDLEWKDLEMQLGMTLEQANAIDSRGTDEGGKLKESGTLHWRAPNAGATNSSGFTALPGGYRTYGGNFSYMRDFGYWWTSSNWTRRLGSGSATVIRNTGDMRLGLSVRCVRH
jgi:uncharacterized protein (TIGR02145 family)